VESNHDHQSSRLSHSLAIDRFVLALVRAVEELAVEELDCDHGKDELQ
jgi:hypothetical protein